MENRANARRESNRTTNERFTISVDGSFTDERWVDNGTGVPENSICVKDFERIIVKV
jgi:hypothetical protein